jgi:hypothetical protein
MLVKQRTKKPKIPELYRLQRLLIYFLRFTLMLLIHTTKQTSSDSPRIPGTAVNPKPGPCLITGMTPFTCSVDVLWTPTLP